MYLRAGGYSLRFVISEIDTAPNNFIDVIEDVAQATGDVVEDVGQATGDVAEDVGQEVGDALSAAETAVRQALEDIDLPDIGLPNINLPVPTRAPSATRTTGGLFDVAQFEHDEGISLVGNLLTGLTEQDAKKLSKKQFQQPKEEMVDFQLQIECDSWNNPKWMMKHRLK